jgi:hypothetical protein
MIDQHRSSPLRNQGGHQSSKKSDRKRENTRQKENSPSGHVDIIALVRSLQRTAGMTDCFRTGNADCDITDCDWRIYCLSTPADRNADPERSKSNSD